MMAIFSFPEHVPEFFCRVFMRMRTRGVTIYRGGDVS